MQEEAAGRRLARDLGGRAVQPVPRHRMTDARQVHADLVRPAGPDPHFEKRESPEALQDPVFGQGRSSAPEPRGHADAPHRIARDRFLQLPAFLLHDAVNQRQVDLLDLALGELLGQVAVRGVVARHQDHAAGVAVQPVHDARPQLAAHPGKQRETAEQRVDQRARLAARPRVDHHPGGLVHGHHVLVLVEDLERDVPRARRAAAASSAGSTSTSRRRAAPGTAFTGLPADQHPPASESNPEGGSGCRREVAPAGNGPAACPRRPLVS